MTEGRCCLAYSFDTMEGNPCIRLFIILCTKAREMRFHSLFIALHCLHLGMPTHAKSCSRHYYVIYTDTNNSTAVICRSVGEGGGGGGGGGGELDINEEFTYV